MRIAIIGNIGAGKTSLTSMLGEYYGWEVMYEAVEGNPYLADFYHDMERWAFNLQIYFLNNRFAQAQKISRNPLNTTIQDRTIYEDAYIFAKNLYDSKILTERDYKTYELLFESIINTVSHPDLLIYLKADTSKLVSQIKKRGRDFEADISIDYLENLNRYYNAFSTHYNHGKMIEFDVNQMDFVNVPADFKIITDRLDKELLCV
jgi:deoxyadenosine/deoxycytidine kinase